MEIKVLHSILHTSLMPWAFDRGNTKSITEKLKKAGSKEPAFESELIQQLKTLLADYPDLVKWLDKQNTQSPHPLVAHYFIAAFPAYSNNTSKFYSLIISKEVLRIFNAFVARSKKWSNKVDAIYQTNLLLKSIKALAQQTVKEMEARGLQDAPTEQSDLVHFVLNLLLQQLIVLYFDVQEHAKHSLDTIISLEDFYLSELNLPLSAIQPITPIKQEGAIESSSGDENPISNKFTFGFNGNADNLKTVIRLLCNKADLINEANTRPDDVINVLLAKDLTAIDTTIHLNCETAIFRYIVDKLMPAFSDLKFIAIEKSALFYSKKGNLIKAQNLYSSKIDNPKLKEEIDKIFKHLQ